MSCVAETNATSQNTARDSLKNIGAGTVRAIAANAAATIHCITSIHRRLVEMMSTNGLQNGLMTQGR